MVEMVKKLVPVPQRCFTPGMDFIACFVYPVSEEEAGVLVMPDGTQEPKTSPKALVLGVGPDVKGVKEGDVILVQYNTPAALIWHKGNKYHAVKERDVIGILDPDQAKGVIRDYSSRIFAQSNLAHRDS